MGKSQKKKAIRRHNPVRVPDSHLPHGLAAASSASSKAEAILPVIHKLGSANVMERTWACAAVSNLIQNDPSTRRLLQGKNIIGALITRLTDAAEEVVVEAAGALRNLCIDGGYDICAEMYNKNIMAPLRTFPAKISLALQKLLQNPKESPDSARRLVYEFSENVITICWCLSETSNKALRAINDSKLAPFLMAFLQARNHLPHSTVNAAAQCLYVLTEENEPTISDLRTESAYITCLLEIIQAESAALINSEEGNPELPSTMLRVLASGILKNISPLPSVIPVSSIDLEQKFILPLLVPQLSVDLLAVTATVTQLLTALEGADELPSSEALGPTPRSDHKSPAQKELEYIERKLCMTQLSLEILTAVCAKIPEPDTFFEETSADTLMEDDVGIDGEPDNDPDDRIAMRPIENGKNPFDQQRLVMPRIPTNIPLSTLIRPLIGLIHPTSLSFPPSSGPPSPSPHPPTTAALSMVHVRALECLNNIFLAVDEIHDTAADPATLHSTEDMAAVELMWKELWQAMCDVGTVVKDGKLIVFKGLERKTEMWEIAVGVMWGIARFGRKFLVPDAEQVQALMEFCDASTDDMIKVKCIGTLECLAQYRESIEANKIIATYLLDRISSPSATYVESCIQAAAALIDIYSDENSPYDINFRQGHVADHLTGALPGLKMVVRSVDRRKLGGMELRERGDEVLENLAAFIEYRNALKL